MQPPRIILIDLVDKILLIDDKMGGGGGLQSFNFMLLFSKINSCRGDILKIQ
jgi:hypothetical protein